MPISGVHHTANRVRDLWEANGRKPIALGAFAKSVGKTGGAWMLLRTAADDGLVKTLGHHKGWVPVIQDAT